MSTRRVRNAAADYSVSYQMHWVCAQSFLSYKTIEPTLVTYCGLQQMARWAFNPHSSPRESWLKPSELEPTNGFWRCVLFMSLEVGDFSLCWTVENRLVRTSRHGLLYIFKRYNSEIAKLGSYFLHTRNFLHCWAFIASCSQFRTIFTH